MNYAIIFKLLSMISAVLVLAFAACMGVEFIEANHLNYEADFSAWAWCISVPTAIGLLFYSLGNGGSNQMFRKEAMAVIGLGWIYASLIGALPYLLLLQDIHFADAIFESTSGLTTTGASVFSDFSQLSKGLMFWRCLSQWIGGLGVVVFFVALLSFLGAGGKILFSHESSAHSTELDASRVQSGVLRIFIVYILLSIICTVSYHTAGMGWFDAVCHMFTTIATGGFSTHEASIGHFNSPLIEWLTVLFMILGATSFLVMLRLSRFRLSDFKRFTEVYFFYILLFISSMGIFLLMMTEHGHPSWSDALRHSVFQVTSLMTTTGFASDNYQLWPHATHVILLSVMVIGGCSGSTAGGLKVARIVLAIKQTFRQIERSFRSRIVRTIKINGRTLSEDDIEANLNYIVMVALICLLGFPLLSVLERDLSAAGLISAVIAMIFNIGPGLNEVGPTENFGHFHTSIKLAFSLIMIMGRLEFYAILVLFIPSLWKRFS